jgi:SNW domain-containing protein 1
LAKAEKEGLIASSFSQIPKLDSKGVDDLETAKRERDEIRRMLRKENERTRRMQVAGKNRTKEERDNERDISEKIALGQAQPTATRDALYDQRLFNQTSGLGTGFGDDDDYNLYEKPLFTDRTSASIYKNVNRETGNGALTANLSDDGEDDAVKDVLRQQPQRGFDGTQQQKNA